MPSSPQRTDLAELVARVFSRRLGHRIRPEFLEQVILVRDGFCWGWSYRYQELTATYICGENHIHLAAGHADASEAPVLLPLELQQRAA